MSARVAGTTFRPTRTYTTLRDVTSAPVVYRVGTLSREQDVLGGCANGRAALFSGHA
jgi:hypothetical protein